jgi:hypothetical protein
VILTGDTFTLTSIQSGGWDGLIFLYSGSFDPTMQQMNFVAGSNLVFFFSFPFVNLT